MILHPKVAVQLERKFINAEQHCIEGACHDLKNSEEAKTQISNFIKKIS